jgi:hypothetical protein
MLMLMLMLMLIITSLPTKRDPGESETANETQRYARISTGFALSLAVSGPPGFPLRRDVTLAILHSVSSCS